MKTEEHSKCDSGYLCVWQNIVRLVIQVIHVCQLFSRSHMTVLGMSSAFHPDVFTHKIPKPIPHQPEKSTVLRVLKFKKYIYFFQCNK